MKCAKKGKKVQRLSKECKGKSKGYVKNAINLQKKVKACKEWEKNVKEKAKDVQWLCNECAINVQ